MYLKIHKTEQGKIVAACDKELIGKVLEEKDGAYMDLKTYKDFYVGKPADKDALLNELADFYCANLVGKKVVGIAVEYGVINSRYIKYIKDVPYIQIYKI